MMHASDYAQMKLGQMSKKIKQAKDKDISLAKSIE